MHRESRGATWASVLHEPRSVEIYGGLCSQRIVLCLEECIKTSETRTRRLLPHSPARLVCARALPTESSAISGRCVPRACARVDAARAADRELCHFWAFFDCTRPIHFFFLFSPKTTVCYLKHEK